MPAPSKPEEWVRLEPKLPNEQPFRERAEWMTTDHVREILQGVRDLRSTVEIDPTWSNEERVKAVLRAQGDFVVMLDGPRFDSLLDRHQSVCGPAPMVGSPAKPSYVSTSGIRPIQQWHMLAQQVRRGLRPPPFSNAVRRGRPGSDDTRRRGERTEPS
jgi:hypothetical protein